MCAVRPAGLLADLDDRARSGTRRRTCGSPCSSGSRSRAGGRPRAAPPRRGRGRGRRCRRARSGRTSRASSSGTKPSRDVLRSFAMLFAGLEEHAAERRLEVAEGRRGRHRRRRGGGVRRVLRAPELAVAAVERADVRLGHLRVPPAERLADRLPHRVEVEERTGADDGAEHRGVHARLLLDGDAERVDRRDRPGRDVEPPAELVRRRRRVDDHRAAGGDAGERRPATARAPRGRRRSPARPRSGS